jgi:molybdopterin-guanine dinucleotide biosynthesis protein
MKRVSLSDLILARAFIVSIQLFRGSTVRELDLLLAEIAEAHSDLVIVEGSAPI